MRPRALCPRPAAAASDWAPQTLRGVCSFCVASAASAWRLQPLLCLLAAPQPQPLLGVSVSLWAGPGTREERQPRAIRVRREAAGREARASVMEPGQYAAPKVDGRGADLT